MSTPAWPRITWRGSRPRCPAAAAGIGRCGRRVGPDLPWRRHSHAVSKRVRLPHAGRVEGLFAVQENVSHTPGADQLAAAEAAVGHATGRFGVPTYARVDLVRGDDGQPCVLELELVEPTLFLKYADREPAAHLAHVLTHSTRASIFRNSCLSVRRQLRGSDGAMS